MALVGELALALCLERLSTALEGLLERGFWSTHSSIDRWNSKRTSRARLSMSVDFHVMTFAFMIPCHTMTGQLMLLLRQESASEVDIYPNCFDLTYFIHEAI